MYISKFKLILYWFLFVTGFYLFWLAAYLLLVRYAMSQISRFSGSNGKFWEQLKVDDAFWSFLFVAGLVLAMYVIKLLTIKAPNMKIAAIVYSILITTSEALILGKLFSSDLAFRSIIPHIIINILFIASALSIFFSGDDAQLNDDSDVDLL